MYIFNILIVSLNRNRNAFFMIAKTSLSFPGIEFLQFYLIELCVSKSRLSNPCNFGRTSSSN